MQITKKLLANGVLAFAMLLNSALPVNACMCNDNCNCGDINISEYLSSGATSSLHYGGSKNNDHSVYFNFRSTSGISRLDVAVYGISSTDGSYVNRTFNKYCQSVSSVAVQSNSRVQIYNNIYETGYRLAGITVTNMDNSGGTAVYDWSPDYCAGYDQYPLPVAPV